MGERQAQGLAPDSKLGPGTLLIPPEPRFHRNPGVGLQSAARHPWASAGTSHPRFPSENEGGGKRGVGRGGAHMVPEPRRSPGPLPPAPRPC